jgi:CelD/BcsL family acetyltransferase involved in cellulose biosynthesis
MPVDGGGRADASMVTPIEAMCGRGARRGAASYEASGRGDGAGAPRFAQHRREPSADADPPASAMHVHLLHPADLDDALMRRWHALRRADRRGHARSPFFTPEYARVAGAGRPDARIAVIECDGAVVGVFPHERGRLRVGRPLGGRMSDYHGPLVRDDVALEPAALLRACGLVAWRFENLVCGTGDFERFETGRAHAWLLRISGGFDAYRRGIEGRTSWLRRSEAQMRRLERLHGPLRFEADTPDPAAFRLLAEWKSRQYVRTGAVDNFAIGWVRDYLDQLRFERAPALTGMTSALYAGERLVAVHLGMRSETVWHYYLPAYDREFASFSPGLCLLHRIVASAPGFGIDTIDLGEGDMDYKRAVANDRFEVARGAVEPRTLRAARLGAGATVGWLRRSEGLVGAVRWGKRRVRRLLKGVT